MHHKMRSMRFAVWKAFGGGTWKETEAKLFHPLLRLDTQAAVRLQS